MTVAGNKKRILVVDDEPQNIVILREILKSEYAVLAATDGERALSLVHSGTPPDLIMLDIMMPNLDGIEVCLRVRQWCLVPIMMLSAWGAGDGRVRGLNLGADGHLTEPFDGSTLIVRIGESLQRALAAAQVVIRPQTGSSRHIFN
jgi:DNA-binding response OmpR family regulator